MVITGTEMSNYFSNAVIPRFMELVQSPLTHPDVLWTVLPLLVSAFFLELYFGRYKTEELGWNTAFGNTISLFWVTTALVHFMYELHGEKIFSEWNFTGTTPMMLLIAGLALWALFLAICNFFHLLPKGVSFFASSQIPVNVTATVLTLLVLGQYPLDRVTLTAAAILYICLTLLFATIQALVIPSADARKYIEEYKKKALEKKKERKQHISSALLLFKERILAQYRATLATVSGFFKKRPVAEEKEN